MQFASRSCGSPWQVRCLSSARLHAPSPHHALRLLDYWLDAQAAFDRVSALSAGVVIGSDLAWSRGYGHVDEVKGVPAAGDTIYSVCSTSKLPRFKDLARLTLPSSDPAKDLTLLRHVSGETFREMRDGDTLGTAATFQRNADQRVTGYVIWNEFNPKLSPYRRVLRATHPFEAQRGH